LRLSPLVNRNDRAINESMLQFGMITHGVQKTLENAVHDPTAEAAKLTVPIAEGGRLVAPGRTRAHAPEYSFRIQASARRRHAAITCFPRQKPFKPLSRSIRLRK